MIIFISDSLFLLYIITFLVIIITIYKCIKAKKIETKTIVITLIGTPGHIDAAGAKSRPG